MSDPCAKSEQPGSERTTGCPLVNHRRDSGNSLQEVHWLDPQGMRQPHNVQQCDIPFPALDSANIIAMQSR